MVDRKLSPKKFALIRLMVSKKMGFTDDGRRVTTAALLCSTVSQGRDKHIEGLLWVNAVQERLHLNV